MALKFGTSGLRALATDLTDDRVADYTRAFLSILPDHCKTLYIGWDLRASSPRIAESVVMAARAEGVTAVCAGATPTPALALAAMAEGAAAIMVTGSHIPADRNGLKFYVPDGEITKEDEARITGALGRPPAGRVAKTETRDVGKAFVARYRSAFGGAALSGLKIGVYQHSSVARDLMVEIITALGAEAAALARSDMFIPVDTEAIDPETREMLRGWCVSHGLDAVISTDGDADRPMVATATGEIAPGDILGPLTAQAIGAAVLCTPVSSNSVVEEMGFKHVTRTRIGSPFVIAKMAEAAASSNVAVAGYEANGGFVLGFTAQGPAGPLAPLMTRDSILPIIAPLFLARQRGLDLAGLIASLPKRFTAAGRLKNIPTEQSQAFLAQLIEDPAARAAFFEEALAEDGIDLTDGLRVRFDGGDIAHLRPSGNAPEFRCYAESASPEAAKALASRCLDKAQVLFGPAGV